VALVESAGGSPGDSLPVVSVLTTDAQAFEAGGSDNAGRFTLERTGDLSTPLTIDVTITGTAASGVDYEALSSTVVIEASKASKKLTVEPIDDGEVESLETVILDVAVSESYTIDAGAARATVSIVDDDASEPVLLGDTTLNGTVSALDASYILQHVAGSVSLTEVAFVAADVSGNGEISAFDASLILQYLVGIRTCFPADPQCASAGKQSVSIIQ
jgi:hypothetical protein